MAAINLSLDVDKRMALQDVWASRAHAAMLVACEILLPTDGQAIDRGLAQIAEEIETDCFPYDPALEDIHMNVEARLKTIIGDAAGRLHTARSRNDQVVTDFRIWTREAIDQLDQHITCLMKALVSRSEQEADSPLPGYTHMQVAQPVTLGHHWLAYVEMLSRDRARLADSRQRVNQSPLGAAALAGTGFPIDRHMTSKTLGFDSPMANAMDAVSARDFCLEFIAGVTVMVTHLSRLAEELVLWSSPGFGFVRLADQWSTGSSIMPQKRNPDAAELVRAKASRLSGHLTTLFSILKALPLTYAKDMQDDKALTFDSFDSAVLCLQVMTGMIETLAVNRDAMRTACAQGFITATDFADWLVRELGLPFRKAHEITGKAVAMAEQKNVDLVDLSLENLKTLHSDIHKGIYDVLSVDKAIASRTSYGGTAPVQVRKQVAQWKKVLSS